MKRCFAIALAVSTAALIFNLATARLFPSVWMDEVMFAEPAANLAQGKGLVSTAWAFSDGQKIWAGNSPLYSILMGGWFRAVGFSELAARAFCMICWYFGSVMLILMLFKAGVLRSWFGAVAINIFLWGDYAFSFIYRSGRYDVLGYLLVCACVLLLVPNKNGRASTLALGVCCLLIPWSHTLLGAFVALGAGCAFAAGIISKKNIISILVCLVLGATTFILYLQKFGLTDQFVASTQFLRAIYVNPTENMPLGEKAMSAFWSLFTADKIFFLYIILVGYYIWQEYKAKTITQKLCSFFGAGLAWAGIATLILSFGYRQTIYNCWISVLPVVILSVYSLERIAFVSRYTALAILAILVLPIGAFGRCAIYPLLDEPPPEERLGKIISSLDGNGDVLVDWQLFYYVQRNKGTMYYSWALHVLSPQDKDKIRLALIRPEHQDLLQQIGGEWELLNVLESRPRYPKAPWARLIARYQAPMTTQNMSARLFKRIK
jgi:hypothetical protein